jgi:tRNA-2-methylthio-N6-dimethylallyladenosine synthase
MTDCEKEARLVVFNTCCVRENAENRLFGNLGNLKERKRKDPNFKIVLCGCMMQQDVMTDKIKKVYNFVDVIFGTFNIERFPELFQSHLDSGSMIIDIWQDAEEITEDLTRLREYPFKAGVNIMYGCDNFCSYCIVPYVRGRERSRKPSDIMAEIKALADDGVSEIMLLGQNVNSYQSADGVDFVKLLHMVSEIGGIRRIRFTSSHPKDVSDELINAIAALPKVCKQLHLPFQAGSSRILRLMNRGHTKEWYLELVGKIKAAVPGIALTTDIMIGFPGETYEDFSDTVDVVQKAGFAAAFTFIYSPRQGTPAFAMEKRVAETDLKKWFQLLVSEVNKSALKFAKLKEGQVLEVLVECVGKKGILNGRTNDGSLVHFKGDLSFVGQYVNVKIIEGKTFYLNGELVQ